MKETTMPRGEPRCMYDLLDRLKDLTGEEVIKLRILRERKSKEFAAKIQYYDETSRCLRLRANYRTFIAYINLRADPEGRSGVEQFLNEYHPY
ncbi:MAG: hypothetical protein PHF67_01210 [Candidatus Nanoarchaeia archaeon]|nr:hypothetical protein [Candidatus Nanoarchaeia archaeon]